MKSGSDRRVTQLLLQTATNTLTQTSTDTHECHMNLLALKRVHPVTGGGGGGGGGGSSRITQKEHNIIITAKTSAETRLGRQTNDCVHYSQQLINIAYFSTNSETSETPGRGFVSIIIN